MYSLLTHQFHHKPLLIEERYALRVNVYRYPPMFVDCTEHLVATVWAFL